MPRHRRLALVGALLLAASCGGSSSSSGLGSGGMGSGTGPALDCVASFPNDTGPTVVCDVTFTCDSGAFNLTCSSDTASPGNVACECGTGQTFETNSFECTTEGAIVAANGGCGLDLSLAP